MSYLVKFRTSQTKAFKSLMEAIENVLIETNITFTPAGMSIKSFNESKTTMVILNLEASKFEEYICNCDKHVISVSVHNLCIVQKCITDNDVLSWYILEEDINKLGILTENSDKCQTYDIKFPLMELNEDEIDCKNITLNYPFMIGMPSKDFKDICGNMKNLKSERIDIKIHNKQLIFTVDNELARQTITRMASSSLTFDRTNSNDNNEQQNYQGTFDLKKITDFTKCSNLGGNPTDLKMALKNNYPLVLEFPVADLGIIKLCLAPAIPKDD